MSDERSGDGGGIFARAGAGLVALLGLALAKSCMVAGHHADDIGRAITHSVDSAPIVGTLDDATLAARTGASSITDHADFPVASVEQQAAEEGTTPMRPGLGEEALDFAGDAASEVGENLVQDQLEAAINEEQGE